MKLYKKYLIEGKKFKKGAQVYIKPIDLYGEIEKVEKNDKYLVRYETGGSGEFHSSELRLYYGRK